MRAQEPDPKPDPPAVELSDASGNRYVVRFIGFRRVIASTDNVEISRIDELRGPSGRTWFVFEPAEHHEGRKLAVQADSATWSEAT